MKRYSDKIVDEKNDWLSEEIRRENSYSVWDMDDSAKVVKERHEAVHSRIIQREMIEKHTINHVLTKKEKEDYNKFPQFLKYIIIAIYIIFVILTILF